MVFSQKFCLGNFVPAKTKKSWECATLIKSKIVLTLKTKNVQWMIDLKGGRQSCQFSKPQLKMDLSALRIIYLQKFLVGALVMT